MKFLTLYALVKSIDKWYDVTFKQGVDLGTQNCALCRKYRSNDCKGCPVQQSTGKRYCQDSPYENWQDHRIRHGIFIRKEVSCKECQELAKKEFEFLKSLLPKGTENLYKRRTWQGGTLWTSILMFWGKK